VWDSIAGIVTYYGMDGPEIKLGGGFSACAQGGPWVNPAS